MAASKVYYEMAPGQLDSLPIPLLGVVNRAVDLMPRLHPLFSTLSCQRHHGGQRVTFLQRGPLRLADLAPLLRELRLEHQLPGIMQIVGLALGGRFDLPERSVLLEFGHTREGPEFEIHILLGMIPDVPPNFLDLLTLGLSERPRELQAMIRWLQAFTPEDRDWPGNFSILSVRATASSPPRISLHLRPVEFEVADRSMPTNDDRPVERDDDEREEMRVAG